MNQSSREQSDPVSSQSELMESIYSMAMGNLDVSDSESLILEEIEQASDRYTIIREVARGGVKTIYLVEDTITGRNVAMAVRKQYACESDSEGFLREARITASLQHPSIVPIYDMGTNDLGQAFFTMKYIEGQSLEEILNQLREGSQEALEQFPLSKRIDIFIKVCDAVAYAHHSGVLHLDLKPANIQTSEYGEVVLCDWGLAEIDDAHCNDPHLERYSFDLEEQRTRFGGELRGTPGFMAPELLVCGGKKDHRTDVFALASILFELVTLSSVSDSCVAHSDEKKWDEHHSLKAIACKGLQTEPEKRYSSVDELLVDLNAYRNGFATQAEDAPIWRLLSLFYTRHRKVCNVVASFIILSLIGAIIAFTSIAHSERSAVHARDNLQKEKNERLRLGREAAPQYLTKALSTMAVGELEESFGYSQTAFVLDPSNHDIQNVIAFHYFLQHRYHDAAKHFTAPFTTLEKKVVSLNKLFLEERTSSSDTNEEIVNLVKYSAQVLPTPQSMALILHWMQCTNDKEINFIARSLKPHLPHIIPILKKVSSLKGGRTRKLFLRAVLLKMERYPQWEKRRLPATMAMKMCTDTDMKHRFKALIPANLALGQPIESSGGNESLPESAVDGNTDRRNYWAGNPFPAYITVDLGAVVSLTSCRIYFFHGKDRRYYQYKVQTSNDGYSFKTVVDKTSNIEPNKGRPFVHPLNNESAQYIRLVVTHNSANVAVHVREFEVY